MIAVWFSVRHIWWNGLVQVFVLCRITEGFRIDLCCILWAFHPWVVSCDYEVDGWTALQDLWKRYCGAFCVQRVWSWTLNSGGWNSPDDKNAGRNHQANVGFHLIICFLTTYNIECCRKFREAHTTELQKKFETVNQEYEHLAIEHRALKFEKREADMRLTKLEDEKQSEI